ncbi:MAG: alpha/beta hydrolase family esterase, partial [Bacteroidota bacterium]
MRQFVLLLTITLTLFGCRGTEEGGQPAEKPAEQKTISLTVDGNPRSFILYLPKGYDNAGKMPLIFVIHGGSGTPEGMIRLANFKPIADREKIILVFPAGIQKNWNDGRPTTPNQLGIDDVSFLNSVWYYLTLNYPVDDTRIYTTGISNGGFMSSRLGCELSNRIAAIAVVAATMEATTIAPGCVPGRPVPAMYIHGTSDPLVPFTGGEMTAGGTAGGTILSHSQAVEKWVTNNNCNPVPVVTDLPDIANDGTTIKKRVFGGGTNGSEVVSYVVLNGGHTWPQGLQYLNELIIGKTSQ